MKNKNQKTWTDYQIWKSLFLCFYKPAYPIIALIGIAVYICLVLAIPVIADAMAGSAVEEEQILPAVDIYPVDGHICGLWSVVCPVEARLPVNGTTTDPIQIIRYLAEKNGVDPNKLLALAWCESNYKVDAIGIIDKDDLGLFQINIRYHEVSREQALEPWFATLWTINKIKAGGAGIWVCQQRLQIF